MTTIQLDISHECTLEEVKEFADQFNCTFELVVEFGPGGGNPVYEFTGSLEDIKGMEKEYWNQDSE